MEAATDAKSAVEDAQREQRRKMEESGQKHVPRFFAHRDGRWVPQLTYVPSSHVFISFSCSSQSTQRPGSRDIGSPAMDIQHTAWEFRATSCCLINAISLAALLSSLYWLFRLCSLYIAWLIDSQAKIHFSVYDIFVCSMRAYIVQSPLQQMKVPKNRFSRVVSKE